METFNKRRAPCSAAGSVAPAIAATTTFIPKVRPFGVVALLVGVLPVQAAAQSSAGGGLASVQRQLLNTSVMIACLPRDEIMTYGYDAKGRLTSVSHTGPVNGGTTVTYQFDRARPRPVPGSTAMRERSSCSRSAPDR